MNKKMTLQESLDQIKKNTGVLDEVDWEKHFGDVKSMVK